MMVIPTAADYVWQFQRLLPRGRIWHRGWGWLQAELLLLLMPTWVRLHARANNVLVETFPCSTIELLPEWEATLGLPDPCTGPLDTVQQRTAAVCAKFSARGGQSPAYFIALAEALGYTIEIETFKPFYASQGRAGDPLYDEQWAYVWRVAVTAGTNSVTVYFRAGESAAGEPLAMWGDKMLECLFHAIAPAHTVLTFVYS